MTTFKDQLHNFTAKLVTTEQDVWRGVVGDALRSIVSGSPVTGAPGQPVDTGRLKGSWQVWYDSDTSATIGTNVVYAPYIEDGLVEVGEHRGNATGRTKRRLTLRSEVGGFHSVALTRTGFGALVADVAMRVQSGAMELPAITAQTGYEGEDGG